MLALALALSLCARAAEQAASRIPNAPVAAPLALNLPGLPGSLTLSELALEAPVLPQAQTAAAPATAAAAIAQKPAAALAVLGAVKASVSPTARNPSLNPQAAAVSLSQAYDHSGDAAGEEPVAGQAGQATPPLSAQKENQSSSRQTPPPPPRRLNPARAILPSLFVLMTLFTGTQAAWFSTRGWVLETAGLIFFAGILSDFSRRSARLLKARGLSGTAVDKLAEATAFGLAPAAMAARLTWQGLSMSWPSLLVFGAFAAAAAFRAFAPKDEARGLGIHAAAGLLAALALAAGALPGYTSILLHGGAVFASLAMLGSVRFPRYKKVKVALALLVGATVAVFRAPLGDATLYSLLPLIGFALYLGLGLLRGLRRRA